MNHGFGSAAMAQLGSLLFKALCCWACLEPKWQQGTDVHMFMCCKACSHVHVLLGNGLRAVLQAQGQA